MKFTDRGILALKSGPERYERWEDGRTGFGIRVSPRGRKSWLYMYRFNGKARRMTIGDYPRMNLADARLKHADAKKTLSFGEDPGAAHVVLNRADRETPTISDLVDLYLERYARPNKKSAAEDERILKKDVVPTWEGLKAYAVTRRHVTTLIGYIANERNAPIQANRTLAVIRKMFNYALSESLVEKNPCANVPMPAKENQRDRVLEDDELKVFWNGLDECGISEPIQIALKLQLLTAQRKQEVVIARWDQINVENAIWTIPGTNTKNGKLNRVPLSPLAVKLTSRLRDLAPHSDWLFPSRGMNIPMTERAIDRAVGRHREQFNLKHFTPHDLRRTAASHMTMLGHSRFIVERILNHADKSVAAVYDRYGYDKEKREALNALSNKIEDLM